MTETEYHDFVNQHKVKWVLEDGVAGKGFFKLDWLIGKGLKL